MRICPICTSQFDDDMSYCPHDGKLLVVESDPIVGELLLGQFQVTAEIDRGAMGTVYQAWQASMERSVAVKVLHRNMVRDPQIRHRFMREARAVARLSHPNIVTVHVVGETSQGAPYLVMEMVDGHRLDTAIDSGALSVDRALRIARQVASALADAHAAGIVHRDLKPANIILVQRRRSRDFVKILDFGIAKILDSELLRPGESHLTQNGEIFGTPQYISPEQAAGTSVDHRADIYSVGVMLYEMVSGRLPFEGGHVPVLVAHMTREVPPISELSPDLDPALAALIMRCLAKDPADRFQSAENLADALDAALSSPATSPWTSGALARLSSSHDQSDDGSDDEIPSAETEISAVDAYAHTLPVTAVAVRDFRELAPPPMRQRSRFWRAALLLLMVAGISAAGYAHQTGMFSIGGPGPAAEATVSSMGAFPAGDLFPAGDSSPAPSAANRRPVIVVEDGYSLRAMVPERLITGLDYEFSFVVWDPAGEPVTTAEMIVILIQGDDQRGFAAKPTDRAGEFRFRQTFAASGEYTMRVHPPAGGTHVQLYFEVSDASAPVPAI